METRTERRTLKHNFTNEELLVLAESMAVKNQELRQQEDEKKSVVSQYGSNINELKEAIGGLSTKIANKFEHQDVTCDVKFHTPEEGIKSITPRGHRETFTEKMSDFDFDLFTQYQGEGADAGEDLAEGTVETEEELMDDQGNVIPSGAEEKTEGTF